MMTFVEPINMGFLTLKNVCPLTLCYYGCVQKRNLLKITFLCSCCHICATPFYDRDSFLIREIHEIKHSFGQTNFFWLEFNI